MKLKFVDRYGTRFVEPSKSSSLGQSLLRQFPIDRVAFFFQPPPAPRQTYTRRKLPRRDDIVHLFQAWTRRPYIAAIEWVYFLPMRTPCSTAMGFVVFKSAPSPCPPALG